MKKYLIMAMAAAAITSCSQDEVMEVAQKQAISFKDAFVENATRAIDATLNTSNLVNFEVYGNTQGDEKNDAGIVTAPIVPIFAGVDVNKSGSDWSYDSKHIQYWIEGNTYNFAAIALGTSTDATESISVEKGTNGLPATIKYDATNQEDLLYATQAAIGKASGNNMVAFTFDHLLSKAMFTVKNTMDSNDANSIYFYRVSDVKITNAYKAGTYYAVASSNVPEGSWVATIGADDRLEVKFGNVCDETKETHTTAYEIPMKTSATSHNQQVLIPAEYTDENPLNITCTIETLIKQDDDYKVVNIEDYDKNIKHTFAKGQAYNFVISLGDPGEPIEFTVTKVNEWNPATGGTDVNL